MAGQVRGPDSHDEDGRDSEQGLVSLVVFPHEGSEKEDGAAHLMTGRTHSQTV